jgi:hypothetical protein
MCRARESSFAGPQGAHLMIPARLTSLTLPDLLPGSCGREVCAAKGRVLSETRSTKPGRASLAGVTGISANCVLLSACQGKSLTDKPICWSTVNAESVLTDAPSTYFLGLDNLPRSQRGVMSRHSESVPAYPHGFDASRGRKGQSFKSLSTCLALS